MFLFAASANSGAAEYSTNTDTGNLGKSFETGEFYIAMERDRGAK